MKIIVLIPEPEKRIPKKGDVFQGSRGIYTASIDYSKYAKRTCFVCYELEVPK